MSKIKVVRVARTEFELVDGQVFPIDPPLQEDITPDEFQEHYDLAAALVGSLQAPGNNAPEPETVGCCGEDQNGEESR